MIVVFNIDDFRSRYPDLADISDTTLKSIFNMISEQYGNSDDSCRIKYDPAHGKYMRKYFLYAVVCHLATLQLREKNGQQGRLASASQGSVSTSFDLLKGNSLVQQWWTQTDCGAQAYMMLKSYVLGGRFYSFSHNHPYG